MHESCLSFSVSHWTVICNRGNIKHIFTLKTLICLIITATEREDRWCTKLVEFGHCVDQVQTVVRVFLDHRIEPQVQFLQILQLVQRKDVLQRRQSVIVQIQCLQHLQTLNALQTSAQQTYNYIYRLICLLTYEYTSKTSTHCMICIVWVMLIN